MTIYVSQEGKTARSANSHKTYNRTSCFNCPKNHEKWGITVGCLQRDYADGIQAGLRFEPLLNDGFGLNLGFFYEYYSETFTNYAWQKFLNIPMHLEYHFNFSKYFNVFVYGGVSLIATNSSFSEYGCGLRIDHVQFTLGRSHPTSQ